MMEILDQLGYGQIPKSIILNMLHLFETRNAGEVQYSNLVEYCRENGVSAALSECGSKLYDMILTSQYKNIYNDAGELLATNTTTNINTNTTGTVGGGGKSGPQQQQQQLLSDKTIRHWFKLIDPQLSGVFNIHQLQDFLELYGLSYSRDVIAALFASMDYEFLGVRLNNFATWCRQYTSNAKETLPLYMNLSLAEIQRKVHNYIQLVNQSTECSYDELVQSFKLYDWQTVNQGLITKAQFYRSVQRAGFPLTASECRVLQTELSAANGADRVSYTR
jgi:Ca2+-binding EF-hand superfamily protein